MKKKIYTSLLLLFSLAPSIVLGQDKDQSFEKAVYALLKAFADKDKDTVNSFINKEKKLVTIYRIGVANNFSFIDSLEFSEPLVILNFRPIEIPTSNYKLQYGKLPEYSCDTDTWNRPAGLYTSKYAIDRVFTSAVRHFMDWEMEYADKEHHVSEAQYQSYRKLEKQSRKVYLLLEEGDSLAFSLTWIDGKWYLTILDRVAGDCSA